MCRKVHVRPKRCHEWSRKLIFRYDQLLNLVIDSTSEQLRDMESPFGPSTETRQLGLVVCRGTSVVLISPQDGMEEIANPFIQQ